MKLLIDCMALSVGGGVQGAIAFLDGLGQRTDMDWRAVLPQAMEMTLPPSVGINSDRIVYLPKSSPLDIARASFALPAIERDFSPSVVFTVFGPAYFKARAPHLVGFALCNLIYKQDGVLADTPVTRLADHLRCTLLRRANHLVVETATVRDRLAVLLNISPDRISVIGNSVNPVLLKYRPEPAPREGRYRIIVPSAYYRHKNLDIVPPVAAALQRLNPDFDFEFQMTLDPQGPAWEVLRGAAVRLGVAERVVKLGALSLDELAAAYRAAAAVFLPTLRESSTAVYPESFYFRRPLVTSDLDFARELCGDAAVFVPPLEPETIAKRILGLAQSADLGQRLVANGDRRLVSQYPTAQAKLDQQLKLLKAVAGRRGFSSVPSRAYRSFHRSA